jgi:hypothetical protein
MSTTVLKIYNKSKNREKNRSCLASSFMRTAGSFKVLQRTKTTPSFQMFFQRIRTGSSSIPDFLQRKRTDGSFRFFDPGIAERTRTDGSLRFFDPGIAERTRTDGSSTLALLKE